MQPARSSVRRESSRWVITTTRPLDAGGCVTPKGWAELHNPASQELRLKQFHLPNVGGGGSSSKRGDGEDGGEDSKDIADLESFKTALNTAREALASALP